MEVRLATAASRGSFFSLSSGSRSQLRYDKRKNKKTSGIQGNRICALMPKGMPLVYAELHYLLNFIAIDDCMPFKSRRLTVAVVLLTTSIPNTTVTNIQIRLLCEDIQQLKAKSKV